MKRLKKILVIALFILGVIGVIWGIDKFKVQSEKFKVAEEQKIEEPLKFAVMGDIHSDWENFRKALEKAKRDMRVGPAFAEASARQGFVIVVGDLTTIGKKSELLAAKKILNESGLKYYVIPGNHDVWWGRQYKKDVWGEVFGESFTSFKATEPQSNPPDGEAGKEIKFILINNGDGVGGINKFKVQKPVPSLSRDEKLKVDEEETQMEWIEKETEECLKIYCLVFMHMPLNHPSSLHVMGEGNAKVASETGELVRLLVNNKVKKVFAGHLHFSSSYELDDLRTTIVGAVTRERNFQSPKFLEVNLQDGKLEEKEVFLTP